MSVNRGEGWGYPRPLVPGLWSQVLFVGGGAPVSPGQVPHSPGQYQDNGTPSQPEQRYSPSLPQPGPGQGCPLPSGQDQDRGTPSSPGRTRHGQDAVQAVCLLRFVLRCFLKNISPVTVIFDL